MDIEEQLIELVRPHLCLYDLKHDRYKNTLYKDIIWADIGKNLSLSGDSCKRRWKALRDTYRRSKQSATLASRSAAQKNSGFPKKKWRHSAAMQFLDEVHSCRNTKSNVGQHNEYLDPIASPPQMFSQRPPINAPLIEESLSQEDCFPPFQDFPQQLSKVSSPTTTCSSSQEISPTRPLHSLATSQQTQTEVNKDFGRFLESASKSIEGLTKSHYMGKEESATEVILKALAIKLVKAGLPEERLNIVEQKIVKIVYDEIGRRS